MRNSDLAPTLKGIGGLMVILGVVFGGILLYKFSQPGLMDSGELSPLELAIAAVVLFYHIVIGILCFGVAQTLAVVTQAAAAPSLQPSTGGPATTKCYTCGKVFQGDLRGQRCDKCGGLIEV